MVADGQIIPYSKNYVSNVSMCLCVCLEKQHYYMIFLVCLRYALRKADQELNNIV